MSPAQDCWTEDFSWLKSITANRWREWNLNFRDVNLNAEIMRWPDTVMFFQRSRHVCHFLVWLSQRLDTMSRNLVQLNVRISQFIDLNLCCFIPGKVIDEIYRVLRFINQNPSPPRVHELLQELRDISSMAMEYFEERVAPSLKLRLVSSRPSLGCSISQPVFARKSMCFRTFMPRITITIYSFETYRRSSCASRISQRQRRWIKHEKGHESHSSIIEKGSSRTASKGRRVMIDWAWKKLKIIFLQLLEMEKRQKEQNQVMIEMQTRIADQEVRIQELTTGSQNSSNKSYGKLSAVGIKIGASRVVSLQNLKIELNRDGAIDEGPATRTRAKKRQQFEPIASSRVKKTRK